MMNPTVLLEKSEDAHGPRDSAGPLGRGSRQRADESLNSLALAVLHGGLVTQQFAPASVGSLLALVGTCPRAAKVSQYVWEPVLA